MPDQPIITVRIAPNGTVTIAVQGVAGADCTNLTAGLESALGTVEQRDYTDAYYQSDSETERDYA